MVKKSLFKHIKQQQIPDSSSKTPKDRDVTRHLTNNPNQ